MTQKSQKEADEPEIVRRRDVLITGSAAVMGLWAGCGGNGSKPRIDANCPASAGAGGSATGGSGGGIGGSGGEAGATGIAGVGGGDPNAPDGGDAGPTCEATVANVEGPYYKAGAPERDTFVDDQTPGTRLIISGHVLDTDCHPIAGAVLDMWQANNDGVYDSQGYAFRGKI